MYGRMRVGNVLYLWDYEKDEPVRESEMTKERQVASDKKFAELLRAASSANEEQK